METNTGGRDVRQLRLPDVELEWWKIPGLNVADRDQAFTKKSYIDLDPLGGINATVEIAIGNLASKYVVVEYYDISPSDAFSQQNLQVLTAFDFDPFNWWRQIEQTISPGPVWESEIWMNRLFVIPPGRIFSATFNNLSPFGRAKAEVEIHGWIARVVN
jgi:hypothetical protein